MSSLGLRLIGLSMSALIFASVSSACGSDDSGDSNTGGSSKGGAGTGGAKGGSGGSISGGGSGGSTSGGGSGGSTSGGGTTAGGGAPSGGTAGSAQGGSPAGGGGAPSGGGGTSSGQSVACGATACSLPGNFCCKHYNQPAECKADSASASCLYAVRLPCDGPEDCPSGQLCCAKLFIQGSNKSYESVACQADCSGSGYRVICGSSGQCPNGGTCGTSDLLPPYLDCK